MDTGQGGFEYSNAPTARITGEPLEIAWTGSPWSLAGLGLLNFFLSIITLGIYHFWGKTEVRRRVWSSIRLQGEPLAYIGRGMELFLGFLIVFGLFFLPAILLLTGATLYFGPESPATIILSMLFYVVIFFLMGVAVYRARRYRLSRTNWRGIRGALVGSPLNYALKSFGTILLIPFTLGWIVPFRSNLLQKQLIGDMRFGDQPFDYTGEAGPLYPRFTLMWIGSIVTYALLMGGIFLAIWPKIQLAQELGLPAPQLDGFDFVKIMGVVFISTLLFAIVSGAYQARLLGHFAEHSKFGNGNFRLEAKTGGIIYQAVTNYLLSFLTLGILGPVATARWTKYLVDKMSFEGNVDMEAIAQSQAKWDKRGEGLAEAFDIDAF